MKNRYGNIVLEAEKGITFEVSERTSGELIIKAQNIAMANTYSENYVNPPIPEGYKHVCGEWNNGFVIERCSDGSQFVWIPVGSLASNGTLDGVSFDEKFGRRDFMNDEFSEDDFHEALTLKLRLQIESVRKYGGFYFSCYAISINSETYKLQSVSGAKTLVTGSFDEARKKASTIENDDAVKSHLTFGAEYDSVLEWLLETQVKTRAEIVHDSSTWGNYHYKDNPEHKTGCKEEWCVNNIYDLAGDMQEWTQEQYQSQYRVVRGGNHNVNYPVAYRVNSHPTLQYGFRVTLWIK